MGRKPSLQLQPLSLAESGPGASGITPGHAAGAGGAETHSQPLEGTSSSAVNPPISANSQRQPPWSGRFAANPKNRRPQTGKQTSKTDNYFDSRPPPLPPHNGGSFLNLSPTEPSPYYDESPAATSPAARNDNGKRSASKSGFFNFAKPSSRGVDAGHPQGPYAPRHDSRDHHPHFGGSDETGTYHLCSKLVWPAILASA